MCVVSGVVLECLLQLLASLKALLCTFTYALLQLTYLCMSSYIPVCVGEGGVVTVESSEVEGVPR